ncbi:MAG: MFS transporter [Candidatus Promineifilaceae bacterium]
MLTRNCCLLTGQLIGTDDIHILPMKVVCPANLPFFRQQQSFFKVDFRPKFSMSTSPKPTLTSRAINRSPVHYGWIALLVGTLGVIMSSPGQTYSFSIFIEAFIRDLSISRSLVSTLYAVGTVTGSLALPFIGREIDKRGNRTMVVVIAVAFGIACFYMSTVNGAIMLLIGIVFMRMLGQSSIVIVSRNLINQWWVRRRGFISGISTLAAAILGTGMFPNIISWLIPRFGWRTSYLILGAAVIGVMVPIGYLFFRERPELYGKLPDGEVSKPIDNVLQKASSPTSTEENWTRAEAVRTRAFWLIAISVAAFSMLGTGLTFHIVSIFADNGLSPELAAITFIPMSLTTALMGIPGGWLIDRFGAKYLLFVGLIFLTMTILSSTSISSQEIAYAYGILFGLTNGFARVVSNVVYANYFGRVHLGAITGLTSTIGSAASGLGPMVYGIGRDLAGSYWPSLLVSALFPAIMAVLILSLKRPTRAA